MNNLGRNPYEANHLGTGIMLRAGDCAVGALWPRDSSASYREHITCGSVRVVGCILRPGSGGLVCLIHLIKVESRLLSCLSEVLIYEHFYGDVFVDQADINAIEVVACISV